MYNSMNHDWISDTCSIQSRPWDQLRNLHVRHARDKVRSMRVVSRAACMSASAWLLQWSVTAWSNLSADATVMELDQLQLHLEAFDVDVCPHLLFSRECGKF